MTSLARQHLDVKWVGPDSIGLVSATAWGGSHALNVSATAGGWSHSLNVSATAWGGSHALMKNGLIS